MHVFFSFFFLRGFHRGKREAEICWNTDPRQPIVVPLTRIREDTFVDTRRLIQQHKRFQGMSRRSIGKSRQEGPYMTVSSRNCLTTGSTNINFQNLIAQARTYSTEEHGRLEKIFCQGDCNRHLPVWHRPPSYEVRAFEFGLLIYVMALCNIRIRLSR